MDPGQSSQNPTSGPQAGTGIGSHVETTLGPGEPSSTTGARDTHLQSSSTPILQAPSEGQPLRIYDGLYAEFDRMPSPRPARSRDGHARMSTRRQMSMSNVELPPLPPPHLPGFGDWMVPHVEYKHGVEKTIGERLKPTIENAVAERDKYAQKALFTGYALNIAIGLQVFLGALTTGLAASLTTGRQAQVSTATLGGLSTLVASYMARARGSGEPELSITRVKDLEQFLRECRAFHMDHAHEYGSRDKHLNERLDNLRRRFEELLGNANGERKLSPVGITATQTQPGQPQPGQPQAQPVSTQPQVQPHAVSAV